jgi:transcriptional regulator with XRE-family HTH domain
MRHRIEENGKFREKRQRNGLSLIVVATALGRTKSWLSKIERGEIAVDAKTARQISGAIERLANFRSLRLSASNFDDLRLPDARNRRRLRGSTAGDEFENLKIQDGR